MKIKFLILYVFMLLALSLPQSFAETNETTVELSIDKQNYKVGETINFTLYLNSGKPLTGGLNIYTVITEKRSEAYVQLVGTVPCSSCAGGRPESLDPPYRDTFHRQINEPGRYYVEANFNNVAKKIYFNVSGDMNFYKRSFFEILSVGFPVFNMELHNVPFRTSWTLLV